MLGMIKDLWEDDWLGKILALIMLVCIGVTVCLIFVFVDHITGYEMKDKGVAVSKRFSPAHCVTTMVSNGKTSTPVINCYPDRWFINAEYLGENLSCPTSQQEYDTVEIRDDLILTLTSGGLSNSYYCDSASLPERNNDY